MEMTFYTVDEFYDVFNDDFGYIINRFSNRIHKLDWVPEMIVMWNDGKKNELIDLWLKGGHLSGKHNKPYTCQIEFEKIEDAVAFKLIWL